MTRLSGGFVATPAEAELALLHGAIFHAAPHSGGGFAHLAETFCEIETGEPVGTDDMVVHLDHEGCTPTHVAQVNCPTCLEWMHA